MGQILAAFSEYMTFIEIFDRCFYTACKDLFIKNRSRYSSKQLLYLLRFFMNKSLELKNSQNGTFEPIVKIQCELQTRIQVYLQNIGLKKHHLSLCKQGQLKCSAVLALSKSIPFTQAKIQNKDFQVCNRQDFQICPPIVKVNFTLIGNGILLPKLF